MDERRVVDLRTRARFLGPRGFLAIRRSCHLCGGVAGATPVVFGVEVIAVLFGPVLVPVIPRVAIARTITTAMAPSTHVVGLTVWLDVPTRAGGIGFVFGLLLDAIAKTPLTDQRRLPFVSSFMTKWSQELINSKKPPSRGGLSSSRAHLLA